MNNKYQEGDQVYAKIDPTKRLIIRRYIHRIYYCKVADHPLEKELAYFERELQ